MDTLFRASHEFAFELSAAEWAATQLVIRGGKLDPFLAPTPTIDSEHPGIVAFARRTVAGELDGRWLKATPAFNVELCEKFRLRPLELDGKEDSIYHPFELEGRRHMEYMRDRGAYDDVPFEAMMQTFREQYGPSTPGSFAGDFQREVDEETSRL